MTDAAAPGSTPWSYAANDVALDFLAAGETITFSYTVTATDSQGATATDTVSFTITGTNDAPVNSVPNAQSVNEDTPLVFSAANGNEITISDADDDVHTVTLSATHGTLSLGALVGLIFDTGDGTGDASMTFTGTDAAINAALAGLTFLGATEYSGAASIEIVTDDEAAIDTDTINITVNAVDDAPYFQPSGSNTVFYWPQNASGIVSFVNGVSFQDADTTGSVTVTIAGGSDDQIFATGIAGVVGVANSGTAAITLTGSIADINAFIYGNNITWDPAGSTTGFDRTFTITIDDNGAAVGGNVVGGFLTLDGSTQSVSGAADTINLIGWNLSNTPINTGNGTDSVTTTWNNGPTSATADISYVGGNQPGATSDSVTMVFTSGQLEDVLSNASVAGSRAALQDYLNGSPSGMLDFGDTSWNATVDNFESAQLALAAGTNSIVTYTAIGSNLPDFLAGVIGNGSDNTLVGTSVVDSISGAGGNDILVGLSGIDSLSGGLGTDLLLGGDGNDTLNGGTGNDILSGGRGADNFQLDDVLGTDVVIDYSYVEGDAIVLTDLLDTNFGVGSTVSDFVKLTQTGSDVTVRSTPTARWAVRISSTSRYSRITGRRRYRISFGSSSKGQTRS